jgi:hypothetical protein
VTTEHRHQSGPGQGDHPSGQRRTIIPATLQLNGGPVDVTNLMVSKRDETIVLDPQVTGACVIFLNEEEATTLRNLLTVWLR